MTKPHTEVTQINGTQSRSIQDSAAASERLTPITSQSQGICARADAQRTSDNSASRLGRRTVRKGSAFPQAYFFHEAPPQESEAQPPVIWERLNGKAQPYRTVRRLSRVDAILTRPQRRLWVADSLCAKLLQRLNAFSKKNGLRIREYF